jgi:hypothetical protein
VPANSTSQTSNCAWRKKLRSPRAPRHRTARGDRPLVAREACRQPAPSTGDGEVNSPSAESSRNVTLMSLGLIHNGGWDASTGSPSGTSAPFSAPTLGRSSSHRGHSLGLEHRGIFEPIGKRDPGSVPVTATLNKLVIVREENLCLSVSGGCEVNSVRGLDMSF